MENDPSMRRQREDNRPGDETSLQTDEKGLLAGGIGLLAGDIGGTKTHLALYSVDGDGPRERTTKTYPSRTATGLEEMIDDLLGSHPTEVTAACFGIACPVMGGACSPTNLKWSVSEKSLRQRFGWRQVELLNDLATTAIAAPRLEPTVLTVLNRGQANKAGNLALVAPGTGLGQALLIADRGVYRPVASEGGHADFAPTDAPEIELWQFLQRRFGHVSAERVLSGQGLVNIFDWLRSNGAQAISPRVEAAMAPEDADPAAVITQFALTDEDGLCREALERFCRILGAVAGNLALTGLATGGVYLGGGIPPKILPVLERSTFMQSFTAKGRFGDFMQAIPVHVIREDRAALIGAAQRAYELATSKGE